MTSSSYTTERGGAMLLDLAETTSTAAPDGGQWLDVDDDHDALEREGLAVQMAGHERIPGLRQLGGPAALAPEQRRPEVEEQPGPALVVLGRQFPPPGPTKHAARKPRTRPKATKSGKSKMLPPSVHWYESGEMPMAATVK